MQDPHLISLTHFQNLFGSYGLYQHATRREPNLAEGYCVDDNARAIIILLAFIKQFPRDRARAEAFLETCFAFIQDSRHSPGTYYNFRDKDGVWLTHDVSEDMYARLARMYTHMLTHDVSGNRHDKARELLNDLLPTLQALTAPRAQAETVIALAPHAEYTHIAKDHLQRLLALWDEQSSSSWPWFESSMTYANALLPHSMLAGYKLNPKAQACLHESTEFLIKTTIQDNIFYPIGNKGWYQKGGTPARYDQQAIEAATMFEFLLAYRAAFPEHVSKETAYAPYHWFLGRNSKNITMADQKTGACLDGLNENEPNQNYGAESMLSYLSAELYMNTELKL